MRTSSVNSNNSFKGNFLIKGHTDLLDEICWYLQKKHVQNEAYTFVDIRNGIWFPGEINTLKREAVDLFMTEDDEKIIAPKLSELVQQSVIEGFVGKVREHICEGNAQENVKKIVRTNLTEVANGKNKPLNSSLVSLPGTRSINDFAGLIAENLKEMMQKVEKGNAIVNIHHDLVQNFHPTLKIFTPEVLDGEEVFAGIRRGTFDISEGILA